MVVCSRLALSQLQDISLQTEVQTILQFVRKDIIVIGAQQAARFVLQVIIAMPVQQILLRLALRAPWEDIVQLQAITLPVRLELMVLSPQVPVKPKLALLVIQVTIVQHWAQSMRHAKSAMLELIVRRDQAHQLIVHQAPKAAKQARDRLQHVSHVSVVHIVVTLALSMVQLARQITIVLREQQVILISHALQEHIQTQQDCTLHRNV